MTKSVSDVIDALKTRFRCDTDAQLAKALGIGNTTVSCWRSRGKVPDRYHELLHGTDRHPFACDLARFTNRDRAMFQLALTRFCRENGAQITDLKEAIGLAARALDTFIELTSAAQADIDSHMSGADAATAFALCVALDTEAAVRAASGTGPAGTPPKTF